jgi:outer membrane scaffolding protein for murein synthesis (MipA/OmpV family)
MKGLKKLAVSAILVSLFAVNSIASEIVSDLDVVNTPTIVGLGVGMAPDYVGSNDYTVVPLPFLMYTFSGSQRYIKLAGPELSINLLDDKNLYFGPLVRYYGSRDDDVEDDVVKKMEKIKSGANAGVFITYEIKEADPRNKIQFTLKGYGDVSGEYDGYLVDFGASYWAMVAERWNLFVGAGTTFADSNYMDTYFSVTSSNRGSATVAELPNYDADSNAMRDVHAQIGTIYYYDKSWLFGGVFRYSALLGDAKDSPVTDLRGDSNQMAAALFAGYRW